MLNENIKKNLLSIKDVLKSEGKIFSREQLDNYYKTFQRKFSPAQLNSWDGEALLRNIHLFGDKDSLAYWLEFKNDDELPARFGSIAGGSALKYGIYFNKEKKEWFTGSPINQKRISIGEAIDIVKSQRDQLVKGYDLLVDLPDNTSLADYTKLQQDLRISMPDIVDLVWSHKYLSMHFPDKLDDFHNPHYQKFNLIKILILPQAEIDDRYVNAFYFLQGAKELDIPLNTFTTILNYRNGKPTKYWRIGTSSGQTNQDRFSIMADENKPCIAIGWDEIEQDSVVDNKKC